MTSIFRLAPHERDRVEKLPSPLGYQMARVFWTGRVFDLFWSDHLSEDIYSSHHIATGEPISAELSDAIRRIYRAQHQHLLRDKFLRALQYSEIEYKPYEGLEQNSDSEKTQTTVGHTDGRQPVPGAQEQ